MKTRRSCAYPPLALAALLLVGCGPRNFQNANDELRAQRLELRQRVATLEEDLQQRLGEIEALRAQVEGPSAQLPGARPPVFAAVKLGRYTGPVDVDGEGGDDLIRLYVKTLDQQGRMLPVAARAVVQAVHLRPDAEPVLYAERTWEPDAFDAAYRTGFTGTHYTLELPLDDDAPDELTVKITVTSAAGVTHSAQQAFGIEKTTALAQQADGGE